MRLALPCLLLCAACGSPFTEAPAVDDAAADAALLEQHQDAGVEASADPPAPDAAPDVPRLGVAVHEASDPPSDAGTADAADAGAEADAPPPPPCGPGTCFSGCCNAAGQCVHLTNTTCGWQGSACVDCTDSGAPYCSYQPSGCSSVVSCNLGLCAPCGGTAGPASNGACCNPNKGCSCLSSTGVCQ